jgi:predicted MFS family arabinose efflux permease
MNPPAPHDQPRRRDGFTLTVLAAVQFGLVLDFMLMMPLGPQFMRLFQITPTQFGFLVSIYTVCGSLAGLCAAFFVDRFDRKRTLTLLLGCFAVTALFCANAETYAGLLTVRAVAGAFGGVLSSTVLAIVSDVIPEGRRGKALGVVMSAFSLSSVFGLPISLYLASHFGWHMPFYAIATLMGLMLGLALWALPQVRGHIEGARGRRPVEQLRLVFGNGNHLRAYAFASVMMFAGFIIIPFVSPYMVANVGVKESELAILYFIGGIVTLFVQRMAGRLSDLHGKRRVFMAFSLVSIAPMLLTTHLPALPLWAAVIASTFFMAIVPSRFVPAMAIITAAADPRLRGSFMSFYSAIQQMSSGLAVFLGSLIIGRGAGGELTHFGTLGWIAVGFTFVAMALARRILTHEQTRVVVPA